MPSGGRPEYPIKYENLTSNASNPNPAKYNNEDGVPQLFPATDPGYTFWGWFSNKNFAPKYSVYSIPPGTTGKITLYANITADNYTIKYELNGGTNNSKNPANYSIQLAVKLQNPTRTGYTFTGWYLNGEKISTLEKGKYYGGDITLEAKWKANHYDVTYNLNGGKDAVTGNTAAVTKNYEYDVEFNLPSSKEYIKSGFYLNGWSTKSDGTGKVYLPGEKVSNLTSGKAVTLYAVWGTTPINAYIITYDPNGGEGTMPQDILYSGDKLTANAFTKEGMRFHGWKVDNEGELIKDCADVSELCDTQDVPVNICLYAQWAPPKGQVYCWCQGDPKWNSIYPAPWSVGCSVTAIAIQVARSGLVYVDETATSFNTTTGEGFNPATLAKALGWSNLYVTWSAIHTAVSGFTLDTTNNDYHTPSGNCCYYPAKSREEIVNAMAHFLSQGYYPIIDGPGSSWTGGASSGLHNVAVVDVTSDDVIVIDPADGSQKSLFSVNVKYPWTVENIEKCGKPDGYGSCYLYRIS